MFRSACRKLEIVGNIHVVVMNSKGILVKKIWCQLYYHLWHHTLVQQQITGIYIFGMCL